MPSPHPDGRAGIDAALVQRLIDAQFPHWSGLPVAPVAVDGWDNRTYRLGDAMTVRLPTAAGYVPAVEKEHHWLPRLAPSLPVAVPPVLALGAPGEGYPYPWSVRRWLRGETATLDRIDDVPRFARSVADFLLALQRCDATDGLGLRGAQLVPGCFARPLRRGDPALPDRTGGPRGHRQGPHRLGGGSRRALAGGSRLVPRRHRLRQPARGGR